MLNNWQKVYHSKNGIQAELLKNDLNNDGIDAVVMNRNDSSYPIFGDFEIYVPDSQAVEAKMKVDIFIENEAKNQ